MPKLRKSEIRRSLVLIIIGIILILPYIIWHSFWCLGLAVILWIYALSLAISYVFKGNEEDDTIGTIFWITVAVFSCLCYFWHDMRYIDNSTTYQHLFPDCNELRKEVIEVTETEGFFYGCFSDCNICQQRNSKIKEQKRLEKEDKERKALRRYLQDQIDRLDNGEKAEEVIETLVKDWSEDEDEDYGPSIPVKYL